MFTFGHARPRALRNLSSLLKPGGHFVLTVGVDYYDNESNSLQEVLQELPWNLVTQESFNIYETEPMYVMVLQKS